MNIKKFLVSGFQGETLNWAIGLLVAFSLVSMIDHWTGTPNDGQSPFVEAFATMQSASFIQIAEAVLLLVSHVDNVGNGFADVCISRDTSSCSWR